MSRRLIAVSALAAAALALTACSGSTTPASTDDSSSAGSDLGLVKDGTLTVATEGTYRPFSFHGDGGSGDLTGFDVE
ncbi:polar amino acid ABC transporter substrate-binding protein, partial [Salmonella enterica subsp. enterica serovar Haifa]|nr:polar amino acid ABC transporter substrate-binding protein [Salmonella enterica subsp. enterica serovar Haifa]